MNSHSRRQLLQKVPRVVLLLVVSLLCLRELPAQTADPASASIIERIFSSKSRTPSTVVVQLLRAFGKGDVEGAISLCRKPSDDAQAIGEVTKYRQEFQKEAASLKLWSKARLVDSSALRLVDSNTLTILSESSALSHSWAAVFIRLPEKNAEPSQHSTIFLRGEGTRWKPPLSLPNDGLFRVPKDHEEWQFNTKVDTVKMSDEQWKQYEAESKRAIRLQSFGHSAELQVKKLNGEKLEPDVISFGNTEDPVSKEEQARVIALWEKAAKLSAKRVSLGMNYTPSEIYDQKKRALRRGDLAEAISYHSRSHVSDPNSRVFLTRGIEARMKLEEEQAALWKEAGLEHFDEEREVSEYNSFHISFLVISRQGLADQVPTYRVETIEKVDGEWQLDFDGRSKTQSPKTRSDIERLELMSYAELKLAKFRRDDAKAARE